jgi:SAM-dependent methyltransferase
MHLKRILAGSYEAAHKRSVDGKLAVEALEGYLMSVKGMIRPIPGVRQISLLRQRISFPGSADYWESNYKQDGTSGDGSYGDLARGKADFLNKFTRSSSITSVIEFGCGDGNQLSLAEYPRYLGLDVSPSAIALCQNRFINDLTKSFLCYYPDRFTDQAGWLRADMAISLDVVYHLIEDAVFEKYMHHLFASGERYIVIYSTNSIIPGTAPHVRHRLFSSWVEVQCPEWRLVTVTPGPNAGLARADFFVYERGPAGT